MEARQEVVGVNGNGMIQQEQHQQEGAGVEGMSQHAGGVGMPVGVPGGTGGAINHIAHSHSIPNHGLMDINIDGRAMGHNDAGGGMGMAMMAIGAMGGAPVGVGTMEGMVDSSATTVRRKR